VVIESARLKLIPATVALIRAEISKRAEFTRLLGAAVPNNWPPEMLADALHLFLGWLEAESDGVGWYCWYALAGCEGSGTPVLVASGGFKGPPKEGSVEIGYSVLPQFQRQGYASEMVGALVLWAMSQQGVGRVVAETEWANPASARVLTKVGFVPRGTAKERGGTRFEFIGNAPGRC
jgi:RimJ/RimL family protein N-acetyltransferase